MVHPQKGEANVYICEKAGSQEGHDCYAFSYFRNKFFQYDQFTQQILSTAALNKEGNALRAGTTAGDKTGVVSEPQRPVFQRRRLILSK